MIVKNPKLLKAFSGPGLCGYCGRFCRDREPHHVQTRGMGGGGRIDLEINLISLGCAFCCGCHRNHHNGQFPLTIDLEALIAIREDMPVDEIRAEIRRIRNLPRGSEL